MKAYGLALFYDAAVQLLRSAEYEIELELRPYLKPPVSQ
jgi:hypothetical protein